LGPGFSNTTLELAKDYSPNKICIVDNTKDVLEFQRKQLSKIKAEKKYIYQDLSDLMGLSSKKIDKFDLIICTEVMEHVGDHYGLAKYISKHLSSKGVCIISVPSKRSERAFHAINKDYMPDKTGHVREFNKKDILSLAEKNGLKPISLKTVCSEFFVSNFVLFLFRAKIDENTGKILEPDRITVKIADFLFRIIRKTKLNRILNKLIFRNYLMFSLKK
jgi:2-polyprenyl-3-methyl-5-hydroxy-6-metoxy-1,4-benzoquinol methylase